MTVPRRAPQPPPPAHDPVLPLFLDVLRDRGHVTFVLADLPADRCGMVELDKAVVVLDGRNTEAQHRATIAHELHHLACPDCPEHEVEEMTAEILVPIADALAAAATAGADLTQVAARLGVDPQLVRARIRSIPTGAETADGVG